MVTKTISRKEAIAWLAGIIDGEGCIAPWWAYPTSGMVGPGLRVTVRIAGCNPLLIAKVTRVLKECVGVGFNVATHPRKPGEKPSAEVVVAGKGRVKKLLTLVKPHLTEKLRQAELMLELIAYREGLAAGQVKGAMGSKALGLKSNPVLVELFEAIKTAKSDHPSVLEYSRVASEEFGSQSSETLRRQLRLDEVMIKSDPCSDAGSEAETTSPGVKDAA